MLKRNLPAGFVVPAQPVEREAPPSGADWVHKIKHDGFRMLVRRDGDSVLLYSRKALDWTARLPAIAAGAALLKAKTFTIDGEAVVIRPDGLTHFEALRLEVLARSRCSTPLISGAGRCQSSPQGDTRFAPAQIGHAAAQRAHIGRRSPRCLLTPASWAPRVSCQSGSALPIAPARTRHG